MIFGEGPIIKNIAGDLNKLFLQGTRAGQPINNVEGDAAADQATVQLMADQDPVIRDISTGLGWARREVTVSGAPPLTLPNSLGKPLKAWSVDVLPYQEGTGDPSPSNVRPIHGTDKVSITTAGKNLCLPYTDRQSDAGITYTVTANGVNVSGTATNSSYSWNGYAAYDATPIKLPTGTYTFSTSAVPGASQQYGYLVFSGLTKSGVSLSNIVLAGNTLRRTVTFAEPVGLYYGIYVANGQTVDVECNIMIEVGSSHADFTPYISPSQTVITLPQTVYTATISEQGGESRSIYALLNDPDKWVLSAGNTITFQYMQEFRDRATYPNDSYIGLNCSYVPITRYARFTGRWNGATQYYFGIYDVDGTLTLDQIKADAAAGKIAICYDLANTTTFSVPSVTIPTPTGTATTWATAEDGIVTNFSATYLQSE